MPAVWMPPVPTGEGLHTLADPLTAYRDLKLRAELGGDLTTEDVWRVVDATIAVLQGRESAEMEELRAEKEKLEERIEKLEANFDEIKEERDELAKQVKELEKVKPAVDAGEFDEMVNENYRLKQQLAARPAAPDTLAGQLKAWQDTAAGYRAEADLLLSEVAALTRDVPAEDLWSRFPDPTAPKPGPLGTYGLPTANGKGTREVKGYPVGDHLLVHAAGPKRWEIAHRWTGLKMTYVQCVSKSDALALAQRYAVLPGDWNFNDCKKADPMLIEAARRLARVQQHAAEGGDL